MLFTPLIWSNYRRIFLEPVGEISLEPIATFRADTQIASRLTIDPRGEINPVIDFLWTFSILGYIFADVAVRFGCVVAKAAQNVDAHFLFHAIFGMSFKHFEQLRDHIDAIPLYFDVPGLVVDVSADDIDIISMQFVFFA